MKRVLGAVVAAALPFLVGALAEKRLSRKDDNRFPGLGSLVDIGDGRVLHARVMGPDRGPTVVFENGMSSPLEMWDRVQSAVAGVTRTVSYDRAGLGWSSPGPLPRTAARVTEDLEKLLAAIGAPGPYVLVGHSYGGLHIRHFADRHPDLVAGIVFVDSAHPDQFERSTRQRMSLSLMISSTGENARWSRFGFPRLRANKVLRPIVAPLPEPAADAAFARMNASHNWRGTHAETTAWLGSVNEEVRATALPSGCELAVVTAGDVIAKDPVHGQLQEELAAGGKHEIVAGAGHLELITRADHAKVVAEVVEDVVLRIQEGRI